MAISLLFENPPVFLAWLIAIVVGLTIHEFSHVLAAYLQGDHTGKDLGRLTLNPFRHIDPLGLALLVIAGFGWGKPAPFNPSNLKRPRLGSMLVGAAGPLSNLVAIIIFGLAFRFLLPVLNLPDENLLVIFLVFLIQINIVLMVFNLLPIPPLDGSRVVLEALPAKYTQFKESMERYGPLLLILLVFFARDVFSVLYDVINDLAARILG